MEVCDDDSLDAARLLEDALPPLFMAREAETGVDDDRAAVVGRHCVCVNVIDT